MTAGLGGDGNLRSHSSNKEGMPRKNPTKVKVSPAGRSPPALKSRFVYTRCSSSHVMRIPAAY